MRQRLAGCRGAAVASLCWIASCESATQPDPNDSEPTSSFVASNPVVVAGSALSNSGSAALVGSVVYVSVPPGTVPLGVAAFVRNRTSSTSSEVYLFDGGFDPLPVPATAGDVLELDVRSATAASLLTATTTVAAVARPIVVRTNPARRKRDVPLNATLVIVFSEPMDPSTITTASVQLRGGGGAVSGQVSLDQGGSRTLFVPSQLLAPNATYTLEVSTDAADLTGDRLAQPLQVEFTTASASASFGMSQIAFSDCAVANCSLFVMNADGSAPRQLTAGSARYAAWSPDGTKIAFFSVLSCALGSGACLNEIFVINSDGSGVTRLTHLSDQGNAGYNPTWSPDSRRIMFNVRERNPNTGLTVRSRLFTMNSDGSALAPLTDNADITYLDEMPAWSPDGSKIAFMSTRDGNLEIYVMNADGSNQVRLTHDPGFDILPRWSPDGTRLAFMRAPGAGGFYQVYLMNADGTNLVQLTAPPDGYGVATWSPDGSSLATVRVDQNEYLSALVVQTAVPGAPVRVVKTQCCLEGPAWSPFGSMPAPGPAGLGSRAR